MQRLAFSTIALFVMCGLGGCAMVGADDPPTPPAIEPAKVTAADHGGAPSDAIVLFDGKDTSAWQHRDGSEVKWAVQDGMLIIEPRTGDILTKQAFADCQLHVEWSCPENEQGSGQGLGNSGLKLQTRYEIQVLDSYENKTSADGQAAAVYSQTPPLVNASRPAGQWQTYDIIFHAPRFDKAGGVLQAATVTVLHNGVLVQDHTTIKGTTGAGKNTYSAHPLEQPLLLQEHGNRVRYRNIWIRPLKAADYTR